jgi:hypothetical protein
VVLDTHLALPASTPPRDDEPRRIAKVLDHVVVAVRVAERLPLLFVARGVEERCLDSAQQLVDRDRHVRQRDLLVVADVAARDAGRPRCEVAAADLDPERYALQLPLVELEVGPVLGPIVNPDANSRRAQLAADVRGPDVPPRTRADETAEFCKLRREAACAASLRPLLLCATL